MPCKQGKRITTTHIRSDYLPPREFMPCNIWSLPELQYPRRFNLSEVLLDQHIPDRGDSIAIYHDAERISYRELQSRVNKFANALRKLGVGKGDRVILRSANTPEYFVWNFACWRIGAIRQQAKFQTKYSGVLAERSITRSPFPTPSLRKALANLLTRDCN